MDLQAIENKLRAARTRLILDKPFLGALVLRLPMVAADPDWCKTTATDARKFYYSAEYIDALDPAETQFVLAHEALHCALSHFARREHRVKMLWDAACDYAINPLLIADGLKPPPRSLFMKEFEGMTAEEIYPCLDSNDAIETLDQHVYDRDETGEGGQKQPTGQGQSDTRGAPRQDQSDHGGDEPTDQHKNEDGGNAPDRQEMDDNAAGEGRDEQLDNPDELQARGHAQGAPQPDPLTRQEMETLATQWQQRLAGAAQQALQAGKMSGAMKRMVQIMSRPRLPWRNLLSRYVAALARDDYAYSRPSSRRGDPAIFPSLRSAQLNLTVVLDTSGSINDKEINAFISEIGAIKANLRARISLIACDADLAPGCPWTFEPWEDLEFPEKITGGGGTSFLPPFKYTDQADQPPDLLIYFTDARGEFPAQPPAYPVLWLVKGRADVPWGQRVQLN